MKKILSMQPIFIKIYEVYEFHTKYMIIIGDNNNNNYLRRYLVVSLFVLIK